VAVDSAFADPRERFDSEINRKTGLPPVFTPGISFFGSAFYGLDLSATPPLLAVSKIAPRPVLFIHGDADSRIPYRDSQRLREAAGGAQDELWIVHGAGHLQSFDLQPAEYSARVVGFYDLNLR